ncbi:MAG: neutral/alkaline non-lysosomal ceramidase N-terminal domain-containing protein, partial [Planctomycetota bacterium]
MFSYKCDIRLGLLTLIGVGVFCMPIDAAETDWRVGVASVDITPSKPMLMSGYANRVDPFKSVGTRLFAKAMAFEDRDGARGVIVTADFIGFAEEVSSVICRRITEATGLGREAILLNASHTHNGPMVRRKVNLTLRNDQRDAVSVYTDWLIERVSDIAIKALNNTRPASLWYGRGVDN